MLGLLVEVGDDWALLKVVIALPLLLILLPLVVVTGWVYFHRKIRNRRESAHDEDWNTKGEEVETVEESDD